MSDARWYEAVWTLDDRPLDSEEIAGRLFVAIGEVRHVKPARYDLDRRGRWRDYSGPRLIADLLTQRTQLVTVAEDRRLEEGGALVVITTGKQQQPPRASIRWRDRWPPGAESIEGWERAVGSAFAELPLKVFVMRVFDDPDQAVADRTVVMAATARRRLAEAVEQSTDGQGRDFGGSACTGRSFFPGHGGEPPQEWNDIWN